MTKSVDDKKETQCPFSGQKISDERFRELYVKEMANREWIQEMKDRIPD